jgi:succinate dehydrogenase / fumarate reductase cytochrome b subunit
MAAALTLNQSTIGKKAIMAVTGIVLYGFVIVHMIGNLKIFEGPEGFNEYSHFLRVVGEPALPAGTILWVIRIVLVAALFLHVRAAIQLTRIDGAGRPVGYKKVKRKQASFASLTLRWGGAAIFFFVIYHILHFTTGTALPGYIEGEPYHNVITGFTTQVWAAPVYLVAVAALGTHLYHGVWSAMQTLGLNTRRTEKLFRALAVASGVGLFAGFATVPVVVLLGILK